MTIILFTIIAAVYIALFGIAMVQQDRLQREKIKEDNQ